MYVFSKIIGFLLQPLFWVVLLLVIALLVQRWRGGHAGTRWVVAAMLLQLALGWELPPSRLLQRLETEVARPAALPKGVAGMVVLGGVMGPDSIAAAYGQVPLNESAERSGPPPAPKAASPGPPAGPGARER